MRFKVLLVDDDPDHLRVLKDYLAGEGFTALTARDAAEAFLAAVDSSPDLIVTDISMPETDGLAFCRKLKADPRTQAIPLLFLTGSRGKAEDQVEGLDRGADDYMLKPVVPKVLAARVRAVLRRNAGVTEAPQMLESDGLLVDPEARTLTRDGKSVKLTRKEFDLLTTLLRKRGKVLSTAYLLETVWGYDPADYNDPRTVQVHVHSLRKKLGTSFAKRLSSLPGLGYRFD